MKKIVLAFGLFSTLLVFPVSAAIDFSVQNVSQDNKDAVRVGVYAGDVLRYELSISGEDTLAPSETVIDLSDVLSGSKIVNSGGGILTDTSLSFPEGFCLTCDGQTFSFFVRANEICIEGKTLNVTFAGETLSVPMQCELAESGPGTFIAAVLALILILGYTILSPREA
jgi:hypothetical protein